MKKILSIIMVVVLVIAIMPTDVFCGTDTSENVWDGSVDTSWYDDTKTEFDISTPSQLAGLSKVVNDGNDLSGKTFNLTKDIVLNADSENYKDWGTTAPANEWTAIGFYRADQEQSSFKGTFDGHNHTVKGLYINKPDQTMQGLFGYSEEGKIINVGIIESYIMGNDNVGGICGLLSSNAEIKNCYNKGTVSGNGNYVGGICGYSYTMGEITGCYNTGDVTSSGNDVGGICGENDMCSVNFCYNTGTVTGKNYVGGISGYDKYTTKNNYNTGAVSGEKNVGGVCGYSNCATVQSCYNIGSVSASVSNAGGVIGGYILGYVCNNCYYNTETIGSVNAPTSAVDGEADTEITKGLTTDDMTKTEFANKLGLVWSQSSEKNNGYPYSSLNIEIKTADKLRKLASDINSGETYEGCTFTLTADIDLNPGIKINPDGNCSGGTPKEWASIGKSVGYFKGTFDGNGHTISGVYINQPGTHIRACSDFQ